MATPLSALAVYAEPLVVRRRVAVLGDSSIELGSRLAQLGARAVQVYDPDADRARRGAMHAARGVSVRALPSGDVEAPSAAFDLVIVPDLGLFEDAAVVLSLARRLVGDRGAALVAAANRDAAHPDRATRAFDYYDLFDAIALQFDHVRMIAQLPFAGVALAELGAEDDEQTVSVDTQLADDPAPPAVFVALASQADVRLDPYAIVQLPGEATAAAPEVSAADRSAHEAECAQTLLRCAALETQIEELRARLAQSQADARQMAEMSNEVQRVRAAAEAGRVAAAELEQQAKRADRAEAEVGRLEAALSERGAVVRSLEEEVARRERIVQELLDRLDVLALDLARREGEAHAHAWTVAELERDRPSQPQPR